MTVETGPDPEVLDRLGQYFEARQRERDARVAEQWAALSPRERRLVREAAVMGFVQGEMFRRSRDRQEAERDFPKDSAILRCVLQEVSSFPDLYPTLNRLGTRKRRRTP